MSLDSLYPYAGDHAIQNAVFALDFGSTLTPAQLKDIQKAAVKAYGSELPDVQEQQTMALNFGLAQGAQQFKAAPQPSGFVMQRTGSFPTIAGRSITVSPNNCFIVINDYTRWANVKADIDRYLDAILQAVSRHHIAITAIGLQYTDVFNWKADPSELVLTEVFEKGTPFLVPNVLQSTAPVCWHSHHGYFLESNDPVAYSQLDNINVSRVEVTGSHSIQILTSHKAQLTSPLWKVGKEHRHVISDIQEKLHGSNKTILRALFTEQLRSKIKLDQ